MNAIYWQKGETIDYTNTGGNVIPLGSVVVLGDKIGIAGDVIEPDITRALHVVGVFIMGKDGSTIEAGKPVYYDEGTDVISSAGTTPIGWAIEKAVAADTEVKVKIG